MPEGDPELADDGLPEDEEQEKNDDDDTEECAEPEDVFRISTEAL